MVHRVRGVCFSWLSYCPSHMVQSSSMAAELVFKSWGRSSSLTPFPTPPRLGYTRQWSGLFWLSHLALLVPVGVVP